MNVFERKTILVDGFFIKKGRQLKRWNDIVTVYGPIVAGVTFSSLLITLFGLLFLYLEKSSVLLAADVIQMIGISFVAGTMGFGVWTYYKTSSFQSSEANLAHAVVLINRAYDLLSLPDGSITNSRVSWVTSARLLTRALKLGGDIQSEVHSSIFEAEHDYQRHRFSGLLTLNGKPLPGSFFMGAKSDISIGQASEDKTLRKSGLNSIPVGILMVVYKFADFPEEYSDPLSGLNKNTHSDVYRIWLKDQRGLGNYYNYWRLFSSGPSGVRSKILPDKRSYWSAAEVDSMLEQSRGRFE